MEQMLRRFGQCAPRNRTASPTHWSFQDYIRSRRDRHTRSSNAAVSNRIDAVVTTAPRKSDLGSVPVRPRNNVPVAARRLDAHRRLAKLSSRVLRVRSDQSGYDPRVTEAESARALPPI